MVDILVLGATGYTGRLVTRYLRNHPQRFSFTFAIGVRLKSRGEDLKKSLDIDDSVPIIQVDVTRYEDVEAAVRQTKVVLNVIGPFWLWGDAVVRACATHGKRYVDLSGELQFARRIIDRYDYLATKTKAIIVPSCGLDALPADISVFLSNRTLKNAFGPGAQLGLSESYYDVKSTISGGSYATLISDLERTPRHKLHEAHRDYALSQVRGHPSPPTLSVKRVPFTSWPQYSWCWVIGLANRGVVQRTYGLFEFMLLNIHLTYAVDEAKAKEAQIRPLAYGPQFRYAEYKISTQSRIRTMVTGAIAMFFVTLLTVFSPARWIIKLFIPKPGEGPSEEALAKGYMTVTNYTECASSPGICAKSVIRGKGDPGYTLTACMISESALALALDDASLPVCAHVGGVLTPATALGGVIVSRLEASGQLQFESEIIRRRQESRKDV